MTSFANASNFETSTQFKYDKKTKTFLFVKQYFFNPDTIYHWKRIRDNTILFSDHGLCPNVVRINEKSKKIFFEKITPFDQWVKIPELGHLSNKKIKKEICALVNKLHDLGYGHGDLILANLGFSKNKFYLLDLDSSFHIASSKKEKWLKNWMTDYCNHYFYNDISDYLQDDFLHWQTDWLSGK